MPSYNRYKTKKGIRWYFKIETGIDPKTGKRKNTTRRGFLSKGDAVGACDKFREKLKNGDYVIDKKITVNDLFDKFIIHYELTSGNKPQTIYGRKKEFIQISNAFGFLRSSDITHDMYQKFIIELKTKHNLAKSTIKGVHSCGRLMFKFGKKYHFIEDNPTLDIDLPVFEVTVSEVIDIENSFLESDEVSIFLNAAKESCPIEAYNLFFLLIWTGMRIGEALALKRKDIDKKNGLISITRTHVNSLNITTPPKTRSSIRTISIEPEVIEVIEFQEHMVDNLGKRFKLLENNQLIFPRLTNPRMGERYLEHTFSRYFDLALTRSGIDKKLTPHKLRHTHISLLAEAGVPLEDIKARVGHYSDKVTEQIYLHVTKNRRKDMSSKFGELMRKQKKN